jgi:hypothetical protein
VIVVAMAVGLAAALAGCGADGQSSARQSLKAHLSEQRAQVTGIVTELRATLARAGPRPDALQANQFAALASRAQHLAATIEGLGHPPSYNTRLRDIGAALVAVANGLGHLATAAAEHQLAAARTEIRVLGADANTVRETYASVAQTLGLPAG